MKVKVKKLHPNAVIPAYANPGDAGLDLVAVDKNYHSDYIQYDTGLAFEIPEGYVGLIFPRSSISKTVHSLANSVGVIDSGYRGSVSFRFRTSLKDNRFSSATEYTVGDKIGQIIILPYPSIELEEVKDLNETERGDGSYGSTD